jgi:hypothetical protein
MENNNLELTPPPDETHELSPVPEILGGGAETPSPESEPRDVIIEQVHQAEEIGEDLREGSDHVESLKEEVGDSGSVSSDLTQVGVDEVMMVSGVVSSGDLSKVAVALEAARAHNS